MKKKPFAKIGDKVTTPDGAYVCRVAKDLVFGSTPIRRDDFDDWQVAKPKPFSPIDEIPGFRTEPKLGHPQVYIEGRWRPSLFDGDFEFSELRFPPKRA